LSPGFQRKSSYIRRKEGRGSWKYSSVISNWGVDKIQQLLSTTRGPSAVEGEVGKRRKGGDRPRGDKPDENISANQEGKRNTKVATGKFQTKHCWKTAGMAQQVSPRAKGFAYKIQFVWDSRRENGSGNQGRSPEMPQQKGNGRKRTAQLRGYFVPWLVRGHGKTRGEIAGDRRTTLLSLIIGGKRANL